MASPANWASIPKTFLADEQHHRQSGLPTLPLFGPPFNTGVMDANGDNQHQAELEKLTEQQCWWHLAEKTVGRLAVCVAGKPDIFPVNYRIDNGTVVVKTAPGFKLAAATLGPAVAFEVDHIDEAARSGWSVVLHGTAVEVKGLEDVLDAQDLEVEPWVEGYKNRFIRINPESVSGREIVQD